jgi:hypothetical protein
MNDWRTPSKRTPEKEPEIVFEPAEEFQAALEPEPVKAEPEPEKKAKAKPEPEEKPRWKWEATGADGRAAQHGKWTVRVQQLGGSGLWRPFAEYAGEDFKTEAAAEKALERVLR